MLLAAGPLALTTNTSAQSTPANTKITILGTGNGALLRSPLTDPENDGVDAAGAATDPASNWNWVNADASVEPDFEGGENAFNVFDHKVDAGGNDKWCCDDPTAENPVWVAVEFAAPVKITHFTVTSGNDTPARDPIDWAIQGSNDGTTYTDIYHFKGTPALWTARLQVILFQLPQAAPEYKFIRYIAYDTPDPLHQVSEIEYYGLQAGTKFSLTAPAVNYSGFTFNATSTTTSVVDTNSVKLTVDAQVVPTTVSVLGPTVTIRYAPTTPFALASQHTYAIEVKDLAGQTVTANGTVTVPTGFFPLTDLPGPTPQGTNWAVRFIWGSTSTNVGSLGAAITLVTNVGNASFDAHTNDVSVNEINYNGGGLFGNDNPYPTGATNDPAWTGNDFVVEGIYNLNITEEGDYTFGFHSDDGFGFRIRGGRVVSVNGGGSVDPNNPEAVAFPGTTGDSDTRAVYHLTAGTHRVEYVGYESGGGDNFEVYWSKGALGGDRVIGANWTLLGSGTPPTPLFPIAGDIKSPAVTNGVWSIRWIFGAVDDSGTAVAVNSFATAMNLINSVGTANASGSVVETTSPVINFVNSGTAGGGTSGLIGNNLPLPDVVMTDSLWTGENYVMLAVGNIVAPEEADYTFGFHTDDGAGLRIPDGDLVAVYGGGGVDVGNTGAVVFPGTTGDSNTRAVYHLKQGVHRLEFLYFENGGGDAGELYVAKGNFTNDVDTANWMLVGDPAGGKTYNVLGLSAPVSVVSSDPGGDTLATTADGLADLAASAGPAKTYDTVNIGDPFTNPGVLAFPKDVAGTDDNNYALRITGSIVVTNAGTYVLGFNSDDGGYLKLNGQTFLSIRPGADANAAIKDSGSGKTDQVVCDCLTGDANTYATVNLAAGTYPFEALLFEQGGGSYIRLKGYELGADSRFVPALSTTSQGAVTLPTSLGPLTDGSSSGEGPTLTVTKSGPNTLTISWVGTGYRLQSSNTIVGGYVDVPNVTGNSISVTIDANTQAKFYRLIK